MAMRWMLKSILATRQIHEQREANAIHGARAAAGTLMMVAVKLPRFGLSRQYAIPDAFVAKHTPIGRRWYEFRHARPPLQFPKAMVATIYYKLGASKDRWEAKQLKIGLMRDRIDVDFGFSLPLPALPLCTQQSFSTLSRRTVTHTLLLFIGFGLELAMMSSTMPPRSTLYYCRAVFFLS